ncbi:hypothetical protein EV421DRAFT_1912321 [Armillaria borealis]|uniref:Uncharacterized protein n=1 Tax=Armillaria borealis TaxID=47425 RepID=A0AA39IXI7_9AGAR|nr:hypothetical protein EV421DRAFT_1912321 [Armillaria borealis]
MSSPDIPSLGLTFGAVYLGTMAAVILFGITNLQTVIYYKKFPGDWWVYRYSVASLWILDALHVALSTHALYHYLINLFGNFVAIYNIVWSLKISILINVLIVMDIQALYTARLWQLDDSSYKVVLWFIVLSVAAAFSSGICEPFCPTLEATFADMLETSDSVVDVFAISSFLSIPKIRFLVWPNSFIFIGINFILPKLYINSALAMLNARKSHKTKSGESHVPRVLRFPPQNRSGDPGEPGVDIVLTESQTLGHPKYGCNCEV